MDTRQNNKQKKGKVMWDPYAEFESVTLPNGLNVYVLHWPNRPWEVTGFLIHSGAEHDPIGLEGLAHFVEHLVSENVGISHRELEDFFEHNGGYANFGSTSYPATKYKFFVSTKKEIFARALVLFGDMLITAELKKFVERERQVILAEFSRHYPFQFKYDLDLRENKVLYKGYWLERFARPLGNPVSIKAISRTDLQGYYDTYYTPKNMSIVCVGGMKLDEITELLLESPFGFSKEGERTKIPTPVVDFPPLSENKYVFKISEHISAPTKNGAYKSLARIPGTANRHTVRLVKYILNKVIQEEVRERNAWTYSIGSNSTNLRYFFEFVIHSDALVEKALGKIEGVVESSIASIEDRNDLFEQTKYNDLAETFMIDSTAQEICDNAILDLAKSQRIVSITEDYSETQTVRMEDVRQVLRWLRPENRWTLLTIP